MIGIIIGVVIGLGICGLGAWWASNFTKSLLDSDNCFKQQFLRDCETYKYTRQNKNNNLSDL